MTFERVEKIFITKEEFSSIKKLMEEIDDLMSDMGGGPDELAELADALNDFLFCENVIVMAK